MESEKKNVMLMVPLLDQGGLERICALTANLLKDKCNLILVVFSTRNMLYDVSAVEMYDLGLGSRPGLPGKVMNVFRRIAAVRKIKRKREIQITYSFGPTANLVNVLSRVKDKIWVGIRGYGALKDKRAMKLLCRRADKVICCAKVMADDIEREFSTDKAECLYNPCDTEKIAELALAPVEERHKAFFEGTDKIIASMSRADDVKGFWHQVKAFSLIKKEIPKAKLMIIGDGDFSEYEKLAEELGVRESVLFTGLQKNPFAYLKRASLYFMTSETEGFPNSMIEAMAVGVPVLSVNCKSGPAEILVEDYKKAANQHKIYHGEYGTLMPVMNPEKNLNASKIEAEEIALANEAVRLLNDEKELAGMGQAAAERSKDFSTERYVSRLLQKMEQI